MSKVNISIDEYNLTVDSGMTIMTAAEQEDIFIPHLCHHPDLEDVGGCGLCIVEIQGEEGPQRACMTQVYDGMIVKTKTESLNARRRLSMELMLSNHVDDCTTCPKYLKCELQSLIQYLGVSTSRLRRTLNTTPVNTSNPLIVRDLNRCVSCGRCVRVCCDVRGVGILEFGKNEFERTIVGVTEDKNLIEANCRFCGACVEVCPTGALQDKDGLFKDGKREEVLITCQMECPAHINVPKYIRYIKEGNFPQAAAVIREKAPFPKSLGMVCMRFCEGACRRKDINSAVSIRDLKRFAAENDDGSWKVKAFRKDKTNKKIAIVGSGPSGLTAAYYLAKLGHEVEVFEKLPIAGGMLSAGIPAYRLPVNIIEEEINLIKEVGVIIHTNTKIESIEDLKTKDYDAVLVAIGADVGIRIPLSGSDLKDVYVNIDFLRRDLLGLEIEMKSSAVVLGGGNVAFDCARTLKRFGVEKVSLACLEDRDGMTAAIEEIEEGIEEGIEIYNGRTFVDIANDGTHVKGVTCQKVSSFYFTAQGKLELNIEPNSEHIIEGEMVIFATGQRPDTSSFTELKLGTRGTILNNQDMSTNLDGVFAAGDTVSGTKSVIEAIVQGRKAAISIDQYLGGQGIIDENLSDEQVLKSNIGVQAGFAAISRHDVAIKDITERKTNFDVITEGLSPDSAMCEAGRCLQCDLRPKLTKQKFWPEYTRR